MKQRIAIIGFGAAGLAILLCLDKKAQSSITIDIFQLETLFSTGVAYQEDNNHMLMNRDYRHMSIDPYDPDSFSNWLKTYHADFLSSEQNYLPRFLFGKYMRDTFALIQQHTVLDINCIRKEIANINTEGGQYCLKTVNDEIYRQYDEVVIAIGHPEQKNHYGLHGERYINTPHPSRNLSIIPGSASVGIVGSGLSAIDATISLFTSGHRGQVYLFNRSGLCHTPNLLLKRVKNQYFTEELIRYVLPKRKRRLLFLLSAFNKELKKQYNITIHDVFTYNRLSEEDNYKWQSIMHQSSQLFEQCWHYLSDNEKHYFYKCLYKHWLSKRVSVASPNHDKITLWQQRGLLDIYSGLNGVSQAESCFHFQLKDKTLQTDFAINATGSPRDVSSVVLMHNIVNNGLTDFNQYGGITVSFETGKLIKGTHIQHHLYAIGHITCGTYLFTSHMRHILDKAKIISNAILDNKHHRAKA